MPAVNTTKKSAKAITKTAANPTAKKTTKITKKPTLNLLDPVAIESADIEVIQELLRVAKINLATLDSEIDRRKPRTVEVRLPFVSGTDKWLKLIESVKPTAKTGFDWQGSWLPKGGQLVDLKPGSLMIISATNYYYLAVVSAESTLYPIEFTGSKEWAIKLRSLAIELLATEDCTKRIQRASEIAAQTETVMTTWKATIDEVKPKVERLEQSDSIYREKVRVHRNTMTASSVSEMNASKREYEELERECGGSLHKFRDTLRDSESLLKEFKRIFGTGGKS